MFCGRRMDTALAPILTLLDILLLDGVIVGKSCCSLVAMKGMPLCQNLNLKTQQCCSDVLWWMEHLCWYFSCVLHYLILYQGWGYLYDGRTACQAPHLI